VSRLTAYLGADPGMGGALALFLPDNPPFIVVEDMPALVLDDKRRMDFWKLAHILGVWTSVYDVKRATVEEVHAIPNYRRADGKNQGMSSSAMFSFGGAFYALQQAIASAGIPMTLIPPATWKAVYGLRGGRENKDMSRLKASQIFPGASALWARKKDDGRAEAALLAHYGSKLQ
jgi:crossover junction endodeoxyribonuclease RuvC